MQFLVLSRRRTDQFPDAEFAARVESEFEQARALYADGFVRQIWARADMPGACILLEADSLEQARERLMTLPLYQAEMVEFSLVPLKPYAGFGARATVQAPNLAEPRRAEADRPKSS
jgi:muconolactone delta-isomerase